MLEALDPDRDDSAFCVLRDTTDDHPAQECSSDIPGTMVPGIRSSKFHTSERSQVR